MTEETITVEVPIQTAQGVVGTLKLDEAIARDNEKFQTAAKFEEWQQPFMDALRERREEHIEGLGDDQ